MQQIGRHDAALGEMMAAGQMSPEQMKRMGEAMKQMGAMMGGDGREGRRRLDGPNGHAGDVEDDGAMAEMQKRMAEMMGTPK